MLLNLLQAICPPPNQRQFAPCSFYPTIDSLKYIVYKNEDDSAVCPGSNATTGEAPPSPRRRVARKAD